ncbi:MAG TPA: SMP-30/gluconolactonase/LRE family protein [Sphingobacteriaceae bacterium]
MSGANWQIVTNHSGMLGEGPVWDAANKRILWVDILEGKIHQFSTETFEHKVFSLNRMVGAIALRASGGLIAALENGFAKIDLEKGITELISDPEGSLQDNRFNDGKCDPAGRFLAGTMSVSNKPFAGSLYSIEPDLSVFMKVKDVTCSNGIAFSHDGLTLYYIDTPTRQVAAFDYNLESGNLSNKRIAIDIPELEGFPDGMTIDTEGMLWIAMWDGWKVSRYNPHTGKLLENFPLPVSKVTSCTFGGEKLNDLYITSARTGLSVEDLKTQPYAGCLFVIKNSGFKGIPAHKFNG